MSEEHFHVHDHEHEQPGANRPLKAKKITFSQFAASFPEVQLPVLINDELARLASLNNTPLSDALVQEFILPGETEDFTEFTEYVPCFRVPDTKLFHAVVYWRAELLNYQFVLITFTEKGEEIDRYALCGTVSDGDLLIQSVATIQEDWTILVVSGQTDARDTNSFDPTQSTSIELELLPDGTILKS
jgi:hypothetical protein